jgi:hypothetical protein
MPDDWEQAHGLMPNDPHDAAMDADADGVSNLNEYRSGTDPRDAASVLRLTRIEVTDSGVVVWFQSVSGRRFQLERTDSLAAPVWQAAGDAVTGDGSVMQVNDAQGGLFYQRFYRCRVLP